MISHFSYPLRVRWSEVDAQKIVFNAHYLTYLDCAMVEYWRALAIPYLSTMESLGGDFYVRKSTLLFHHPAYLDDMIEVKLTCKQFGNSSMTVLGEIYRGDSILLEGEITYVYAAGSPPSATEIPKPLRLAIERFENQQDILTVKVGTWAELGKDASTIRKAVFVKEQGVDETLELDDLDAQAVQAIIYNCFDQPVATGRLVQLNPATSKIGRMAVHKSLRGTQLGSRVLRTLIEQARQRGDAKVILHAQASAVAFYAKHGFSRFGESFVEAGILHQKMALELK
ncbi:MAG: YbgC/FadM family acyl-CoA thioesterase [Gammaproteobacteria bacterium]|nr:YbgC/FadM family acyl-CoA thioesterase [Gammaproteobacteria bacterium]